MTGLSAVSRVDRPSPPPRVRDARSRDSLKLRPRGADPSLDACVHPTGISNWDVAAAGLIAEEGGVTVTTADGEPWFELSRPAASIGIIAAPPRHHGTLLGLFRAAGPG